MPDGVRQALSAPPTLRVMLGVEAAEVQAIVAGVGARRHDGSPLYGKPYERVDNPASERECVRECDTKGV